MGKMKELNKLQQHIVDTVMSNQDLLKALYYTDNTLDFDLQKNITTEQKRELKKNNIYEYRFVPDSQFEEQKIFVSMEYGVVNYAESYRDTGVFSQPTFIFYIITYDSLDATKHNGSRVNYIQDCIVETFHKKNCIEALGMSEVSSSSPIYIQSPHYVGRQVTIKFIGNKVANPYGGYRAN